jgi:hypothetical protein
MLGAAARQWFAVDSAALDAQVDLVGEVAEGAQVTADLGLSGW